MKRIRSSRPKANGVRQNRALSARSPQRWRGPDRAPARGGAESVRKTLDSQPWDELTPHLLRCGADPERTIPLLRHYAERVILWNRNVSNIISKNDEARFVVRHLVESIEPAYLLSESGMERWLDFGSGAGLPAIPLAIAGVGKHWTLVESRRPKALFLSKLLQDIVMKNVQVAHSRLEELEWPAAECSGFTSRATLPLVPTLLAASRLIPVGGYAFLWKGSRREAEMKADEGWEALWELDRLLGLGQGQTVVARFKRR